MLTNEDGFTFVELIMVIVILAILLTSVSAYFSSLQEQINASACKANQMGLVQAQKLHYTYFYLNEAEGKYAEEIDELIPFIQSNKIPDCPSGGSYSIQENSDITCSISRHKRIK